MLDEVRNNILNVITSCDTLQFATFGGANYPETRTIANMLNRKIENLDNLFFVTTTTSHKANQIRKNNNVCLYYFNPITRHTMTLFGIAEIIEDTNEKSKFWMDDFKNYGYKDEKDKNYCIIKFIPKKYKYYMSAMDERNGNL